MDTLSPQLAEAGLTQEQAAVYETLLRKGTSPARDIALEAKIGRTLGYAVLDQLVTIGLALKAKHPGSKTLFSPAHPSVLEERILSQQKSAERSALTLKALLPDLSSMYNLATGRPGVRFYEGEAGIQQVLEDTLTAKETVYSYADLEMIERNIPDINRSYVAKRERLGVKKKALLLDTQENRFLLEGYHVKITDVKLVRADSAPFKTVMQIYDGRISYFTLGVKELVGVIITDKHIYEMHKALFDAVWDSNLARTV